MMLTKFVRWRAACAALMLVLAAGAAAQGYPARPVKLVVPNPPGGITDVVARLVGQRLSETWGQPVIIDNKPGGAQMIGAEAVAKAPPDGYTLLVSDGAVFIANPHLYSKLPYDPIKDFSPIAVLCQVAPVMSVTPSLPVRSVQELIALAKAKPGALSYGSFGSGTYAHVSMEQLKKLAGIDIVHVPYKGAAPAINDLLSGRIAVMLSSLSTADPHAKAGKLRIIAAGTARRLTLRPDLPTVAESGFPGFETGAWFGIVGPANLPGEIVAKVNSDALRAIGTPEMREHYARLGLEQLRLTPEQYAQYIRTELERWGGLIRASGAKAD